jgi:hypothetical protein
MDDDITWHISKSNRREDLNNDFINDDKRIKIYNVDCEDTEVYKKRIEVLSKINSGYFCFLDDDTLFHENMYIKYKECEEQNFIGMLVGEQLNPANELRLIASPPRFKFIDTGNVLAHTNCLETCRWPETYIKGVNQKDFLFWDSVYNYYNKQCAIWNSPISYYNKLSKDDRWKKEKKVLKITRQL